MNTDNLISEIEAAFAEVTLGNGIGLWEAQAVDDYESKSVQKEKRRKDEKLDWLSFKYSELQRCHGSLSFFDADGMRFHLPAFLIGSIKNKLDDPIFHLTSLDEYGLSKFTTLSGDQIKAIVSYLNWCIEQDKYEFERPKIERALNEYWNEKI